MNYILDTCAISELLKKDVNQNLVNWISSIEEEFLFLSVITIGEISKGVSDLPKGARKKKLFDWLNNDLLVRFKDRVLGVDKNVMLKWGELVSHQNSVGKTLPVVDSIICAQAISFECVVVTRSEKDFNVSGVKVVNPWKE